jgi:hypothetical protein
MAPASAPAGQDPERLYRSACLPCHGADGSGRSAPVAVAVPPLDFSNCRLASAERDSDWAVAIARGGPAVGRASEMPSFGDTINAEDIDALVRHLRTFCADRRWPSGQVNVPRPIGTAKAFPEDEIVVGPGVWRRPGDRWRFALDNLYSMRVGRRAAVEVGVPLETVRWVTGYVVGIGDVSLSGKYVLHASRERIATAGFETRLPTGSRRWAFGEGTARFEPFLAVAHAKPRWAIQAELRGEIPAHYRTLERDEENRHLLYNAYLGYELDAAPSAWSVAVELHGLDNRLAITPQVRKGLSRTGALAAALGVRLPVRNGFLPQEIRWAGYLQWAYREPIRARR